MIKWTSRRAFLTRTALATAGLALARPLLAELPGALPAATDRTTLAKVARAIFPHPMLADAIYLKIVDGVLAVGKSDALLAATASIRRAIVGGGKTGNTSDQEAIAALLTTPAGQAFRVQVMIGLYNNLNVTRRFGYQGPSLEFGGYLDHGFNDLDWLPMPEIRHG